MREIAPPAETIGESTHVLGKEIMAEEGSKRG